jgi:heme b synthase
MVPRVLAVEVTRRCNLKCIHCRATATPEAPEGDMSLEDYRVLFADTATFASPIVVLTGGEPLLRSDIFDIAAAAREAGLRVALSTNGTLLDAVVVEKLQAAGVSACSISLDGAAAGTHDDFRRQPGSFAASLRGIEVLKLAGVPVQINTSLTERNAGDLEDIFNLVKQLGVRAWHLFMIVPTGRAGSVANEELIKAEGYERILNRVYEWNRDEDFEIKPTCAPQYYRILRQRAAGDGIPVDAEHFGINARTRGCLAGLGFAFVSYQGEVFPCGYYPIVAGSVIEGKLSEIWRTSPLFEKLRDFKGYKGACGHCRYIGVCGGCRARALAFSGDDLAEEPFCYYKDTEEGSMQPGCKE